MLGRLLQDSIGRSGGYHYSRVLTASIRIFAFFIGIDFVLTLRPSGLLGERGPTGLVPERRSNRNIHHETRQTILHSHRLALLGTAGPATGPVAPGLHRRRGICCSNAGLVFGTIVVGWRSLLDW
jgi:hypothetical protein